MPDLQPTIEQMIEELRLAGWTRLRANIWRAPQGGLFRGPYGAWKAMLRHLARAAIEANRELTRGRRKRKPSAPGSQEN